MKLSIYFFISVRIYGFLFCLLFMLKLKLSQTWPEGSPTFIWLLCPFNISPRFFEHFFISGTTRHSRQILYFPGRVISSRGLWYIMAFRNQHLGSMYGHCYCSVTVPRPSQWTELENICLCTYKYITYIY